MNKYVAPSLELVKFSPVDVIATSTIITEEVPETTVAASLPTPMNPGGDGNMDN